MAIFLVEKNRIHRWIGTPKRGSAERSDLEKLIPLVRLAAEADGESAAIVMDLGFLRHRLSHGTGVCGVDAVAERAVEFLFELFLFGDRNFREEVGLEPLSGEVLHPVPTAVFFGGDCPGSGR